MDWKNWKHITKLDPDREISAREIEEIVKSGTDAVMISGTQGVTLEKVKSLLSILEDYSIPKVLEPSAPEQVIYDVDYVFVPSVINSMNPEWIVSRHKEWIQNSDILWEKIVPEAYIVLNPDSAVGKVTSALTDLKAEEVAAYALCAEKYFQFPIVYIEYSGVYGNPEIVKAVSEKLTRATLYYGGGINSREKAEKMSQYAGTIVVGNALYEQGVEKLIETVKGAEKKTYL